MYSNALAKSMSETEILEAPSKTWSDYNQVYVDLGSFLCVNDPKGQLSLHTKDPNEVDFNAGDAMS